MVGFNSATIINAYASGAGGYAGLVEFNAAKATITNAYWNSSINTVGIGAGTGSAGAVGLTAAQMQTASNFAGFNFGAPGAPGNNWVIVDIDGTLNNAGGAAGATRPMLVSEYSTIVTNTHQLQLMSMDLGASYALGRDIDASSTATTNDVWSGGTFVPIGNDALAFSGAFDGLGHVIGNLT
ncbi:MAG: hypothetical protein ACTS5I_10415, partial [Rhodanobacter sp.]